MQAQSQLHQRASDRTLPGAKPAGMAIEVFAQHQLVISLEIARELGVTV
ncbi:MAG: hypothetical protein ABIU95_15790 [Burkholderiales bacterium]